MNHFNIVHSGVYLAYVSKYCHFNPSVMSGWFRLHRNTLNKHSYHRFMWKYSYLCSYRNDNTICKKLPLPGSILFSLMTIYRCPKKAPFSYSTSEPELECKGSSFVYVCIGLRMNWSNQMSNENKSTALTLSRIYIKVLLITLLLVNPHKNSPLQWNLSITTTQ